MKFFALLAGGEIDPVRLPQRAQTILEQRRLGADFAGKKVILADQQIILIIVECHRHAVVGKQLEGYLLENIPNKSESIQGMLQNVEKLIFSSLLWENEIHPRTVEAVIYG